MSEDTAILSELMLHADQFCGRVESVIKDAPPEAQEEEELRLKVGQCRNLLARLQTAFDRDELNIGNVSVRGEFRQLVMAILWVSFRSRRTMDFKLFRMVVQIESGFTYLLIAALDR